MHLSASDLRTSHFAVGLRHQTSTLHTSTLRTSTLETSHFALTSYFHFALPTSHFPTSDFKRQTSNFLPPCLSTNSTPRSSPTSPRSRQEGRAKAPERIIVGYVPASGARGPRYRLHGSDRDFLRMNSNSYLSLSNHPEVLAAADAASHAFGAGPGAVRFIDGTFAAHARLEAQIARFVDRPAARSFNSAYTTVLGLAITLVGPGHLLDRGCAQPQLHHPGDADRERPFGPARDLQAQRPR